MGRRRKHALHLPHRMQFRHGAYYLVAHGKWTRLSREYGEALRKWAELSGSAPDALTVADAMARYIEVSARRLKPATLKNYAWSAKHLGAVFGAMRIEDLTRAHVYEYMTRKGNVSANRDRAMLSATYTHLLNAGLFTGANPAASMRYRNPEKPRQRYVTDAELDRLVAAARGRMPEAIKLAYATGMREGDLVTLQLSAATPDGIAYTEGKTGHPHLIAWTDRLRAIWREGAGARIGAQPWLLAKGARGYTVDGFRASWRAAKLRAKLPDVTFHDLRRKAGSDVDEPHAQALLGHSNPAVTRRHYRAKIEAVQPVDNGQPAS